MTSWRIMHGDCAELMAAMPEGSVDAIVTDPPYGLGFMGKDWDSPGGTGNFPMRQARDARTFQGWCESWGREALRVLRPGGYLLAFGGTRTYHRLVSGLEDAGFEIRDNIAWSHMAEVFCRCDSLPYSHNGDDELRRVRPGVSDLAEATPSSEGTDVLAPVQRQAPGSRVGDTRTQGPCELDGSEPRVSEGEDDGRAQPGVEGRRHPHEEGGELSADPLRSGARLGAADGPQGRVHHGASAADGAEGRAAPGAVGGGTSHRPRRDEQRADEPRALAVEWIPQGGGAWPGCPRCGKPLAPPFFGGPLAWYFGSGFPKHPSCLKPAHEPIVLARKASRYSEPLQIDAARIATDEIGAPRDDRKRDGAPDWRMPGGTSGDGASSELGRWPANVALDPEAAAMLDEQSGDLGVSAGGSRGASTSWEGGAVGAIDAPQGFGDSGGASRFFYVAKPDTAERNVGLDGRNPHPTVKPVELMRWLCRLVTPPGGTVLDPFTGSGTTGIAAMREGFSFIGIEQDAAYVEVARARIIGDAPLLNTAAEAA